MRDTGAMGRGSRTTRAFAHPGRVIAGAFLGAVILGTGLLSLPGATESGHSADLQDALFTATSAVCVTGLVIVDTSGHWSGFGEAVILLLIQAGGLGIMTLATLVAILLSRRLGLRARLIAQAETKALTAADVRRVIRNIVIFSLSCELVAGMVLTSRFILRYDESVPDAIYSGVFHSVSAFNNAGFSLHSDNLMRYVADPWVSLTVACAVIIGGLGFPVVFELARSWRRPRTWSVVTRVTVLVTALLLVSGTLLMWAAESSNPETLGALDGADRGVAAFFTAVMPRTAGFNSLDMAELRPETLFITDILMFIGGGSAGTAGGIKVTTFGILGYVMWAEARGDADVNVGRRRVPVATQRQAVTIALMAVAVVISSTLVLLALTEQAFDDVLFEAISAFSTVGLSTGVTTDLPVSAHLILVVLMFVGRVGPLTLMSGLALRERAQRYRLPEERSIVG